MASQREQGLHAELQRLRHLHRELNAKIDELDAASAYNDLMVRRLKKQKLALKDQISRIELELLPDIIA
ncbi:MAG: DUF465 domain-containing protein [Rhodobiaceae bacterium]|nr:DUF465 domain-containing protein [Rhodobiaceae bacterium]